MIGPAETPTTVSWKVSPYVAVAICPQCGGLMRAVTLADDSEAITTYVPVCGWRQDGPAIARLIAAAPDLLTAAQAALAADAASDPDGMAEALQLLRSAVPSSHPKE